MTLSLTSTYNLKAVLKETGIKPDVLRAWERRYGVPMPQRTAGGHRLYSEHDIQMIKWLISRQNDGLSISRAVELWKENISSGNDPLREASARQGTQLNITTFPPIDAVLSETNIDTIRAHWLSACMKFNETAAEQILTQAFALYPVETVCLQVLQRGMVDIGTLWHENQVSIQQEHFASALAMRRLDALMAASPAPTRARTVLIGCPADEWHAFTPLLIALFVRRRGFNVIYLGANVPSTHLVETVKLVNADMVVLASQTLITAASLQESAALVSAEGTITAFGGRIFAQHPDLVNCIAGNYLGNHLEAAIDMIETLLAEAPKNRLPVPPSPLYTQTIKHFMGKRSFVEAGIDGDMRSRGVNTDYFSTAHKFMGDNIIAALRLGDMNYLDNEIDWLKVMLASYHLPKSVVFEYLEAYRRAIQTGLDEKAGLIVDWFDSQLLRSKANR